MDMLDQIKRNLHIHSPMRGRPETKTYYDWYRHAWITQTLILLDGKDPEERRPTLPGLSGTWLGMRGGGR